MIERRHAADGTESTALYSPCDAYRYRLTRSWNANAASVLFVMLNPSTATERQNDPTIARCERRARDAGFGGYTICNLFAWRATTPAELRLASDPIGPENDRVLLDCTPYAAQVICAWGVHGALHGRGFVVRDFLRDSGTPLFHLGLTQAGHPRHPLYLSYSAKAKPWTVQPKDD